MMSCASICRQRSDGLSQCGEALGFVRIHPIMKLIPRGQDIEISFKVAVIVTENQLNDFNHQITDSVNLEYIGAVLNTAGI